MSGLYRAPAYLALSWRSGFSAAMRAGSAEFALFCVLSGLTGAAVQRLRHVRPAWLARALILGALPLAAHTCEYLMHRALQTPARRSGLLVSVALSVMAEAFTWHAMSRGVMLAGAGGGRLLDDLRRMPALVASFLLQCVPPRRRSDTLPPEWTKS